MYLNLLKHHYNYIFRSCNDLKFAEEAIVEPYCAFLIFKICYYCVPENVILHDAIFTCIYMVQYQCIDSLIPYKV